MLTQPSTSHDVIYEQPLSYNATVKCCPSYPVFPAGVHLPAAGALRHPDNVSSLRTLQPLEGFCEDGIDDFGA